MPHQDPMPKDGCNVVSFRRVDRRMSTCRDETRVVVETKTTAPDIVDRIAAQFPVDARNAPEHAYEQLMVEHYLRSSDSSCSGPHILVVKWSLADTCHVISTVRDGTGDVAGIKLIRLGSIGSRSATLAVSLPKAIFDAAIMTYVEDPTRSVAACVLGAIEKSDRDEPDCTPMTIIGPDELPF